MHYTMELDYTHACVHTRTVGTHTCVFASYECKALLWIKEPIYTICLLKRTRYIRLFLKYADS